MKNFDKSETWKYILQNGSEVVVMRGRTTATLVAFYHNDFLISILPRQHISERYNGNSYTFLARNIAHFAMVVLFI